MEVNFWSVVPALIAIILAILTKDALISLLTGILCGCIIISQGNPLYGFINFFSITTSELSDTSNINVLLIVIFFSGFIGIVVRSGGMDAFSRYLTTKLKSKHDALILTWILSLLLFFDDYFNVLINGSLMRSIFVKKRIPREKLAYSIDSTAVGICLISPVSSWVAFIVALIAGGFYAANIKIDAFQTFLGSIPYNYYAWLSILMVGAATIFQLNIGGMRKAEKRTFETGQTSDGAFSSGSGDKNGLSSISPVNGRIQDLLIPLVFLFLSIFCFMLLTGGFFYQETKFDFIHAITNIDGASALIYASFLSVIFATVYLQCRKLSGLSESVEAFITGVKDIILVLVLLVCSWVIGGVCGELQTGAYIASLLGAALPSCLAPAVIFIFTALIALTTGVSWGAYAIMMPVAISIVPALNADFGLFIAAVIGGGGFGSHCSPLSDNVIISSASANIRHIDHVKTQIPYSAVCASITVAIYILTGITQKPAVLAAVCALIFAASIFVLKLRCQSDKRRAIR